MNKKQTAVSWLSDKLCEILGDNCNELTKEQTLRNNYAIKQAIQMEREQIEDAFNAGYNDHEYNNDLPKYGADSDAYYTQTYCNPCTPQS